MKHPDRKSAFTLVELLVIASFTMFLATLVVPLYRAQKDKAMGEQCAANLKQIGAAFKLYGNDWGGKFPNCAEGSGPAPAAPGNCLLYAALKPYLPGDGTRFFQCPADTGDALIGGSPVPYYTQVWRSSYAWPVGWGYGWINGLPQDNPVRPGYPAWMRNAPLSKRPALFEHRPWHRITSQTAGTGWSNISGSDNTLFCDGHVERAPHNWLIAWMTTGYDPGPW